MRTLAKVGIIVGAVTAVGPIGIPAYFSWATGQLCTQYYEEMLREKAALNQRYNSDG